VALSQSRRNYKGNLKRLTPNFTGLQKNTDLY